MEWRVPQSTKRKYEAAARLGLIPKLLEKGWPGLSASETGRVGAALRYRTDHQE